MNVCVCMCREREMYRSFENTKEMYFSLILNQNALGLLILRIQWRAKGGVGQHQSEGLMRRGKWPRHRPQQWDQHELADTCSGIQGQGHTLLFPPPHSRGQRGPRHWIWSRSAPMHMKESWLPLTTVVLSAVPILVAAWKNSLEMHIPVPYSRSMESETLAWGPVILLGYALQVAVILAEVWEPLLKLSCHLGYKKR